MKKTVSHNGQNIKVEFTSEKRTFIVDKIKTYRNGEKSTSLAHGTRTFNINEKSYIVDFTYTNNKTITIGYQFEGFKCGDSEKKMIEFIISKYGI